MTPQDKIKALAELDGKPEPHSPSPEEVSSGSYYQWEPAYLTNYDAIIPLIQKAMLQTEHQAIDFQEAFFRTKEKSLRRSLNWGHGYLFLKSTPTQLADALLIATGKMKE